MNLQNLFTSLNIGQVDVDLAVEAAGAQERVIEDICAVGRRHDDDALVGLETVHLHEDLV